MPRPKDIPDCPKAPIVQDSGQETRQYEIELITPMFGGGVEAGVNDRSFPIRPTSIRGQLRFWWRATRGLRFTNDEELWLREEEIFGSTRFPSPLQVRVTVTSKNLPNYRDASEVYRFGPEGYVLFPLPKTGRLLLQGFQFHVELTWPSVTGLNARRFRLNEQLRKEKQRLLPSEVADLTEDVEAAVRGWVNFGGLGARTRRGCGSLYCPTISPNAIKDVGDWFFTSHHRSTSSKGSSARWSQLAGQLIYHPQARNPIDAWLNAARLMKDFRQGPKARNRGGTSAPGRSWFPEPETIRETMSRRSSNHERQSEIPCDAFPRAEFGLPIVFQFKHNEVPQTVLYPKRDAVLAERMASPIILKPIALSNKQAVSAIIPLNIPWFTHVELTVDGRKNIRKSFPREATRRPDLAEYPNSPLSSSSSGSALDAFLAYAQSQGFREVTL